MHMQPENVWVSIAVYVFKILSTSFTHELHIKSVNYLIVPTIIRGLDLPSQPRRLVSQGD